MIHQILNINEYKIHIDYTVKDNLKSFKDEVLDHLYNLYKLNGDMPLLFSGGMDSSFILRSLLELGIKPKMRSISFSPDNSDYECELIKKRCNQYGVNHPEFLYMNRDSVIRYSLELINDRNIAYPMVHGFYVHYLLNVFKEEKFYCGMGSEFKLVNNYIMMPFGPQLVKQHNPNRLFDFTTSRTFLSYLDHPEFSATYKKPVPNGYRADLFARDQIYTSIYPDIFHEQKRVPKDQYIADIFHIEIFPHIQRIMPWLPITKNYYFNVDNYFNKKKENNAS